MAAELTAQHEQQLKDMQALKAKTRLKFDALLAAVDAAWNGLGRN